MFAQNLGSFLLGTGAEWCSLVEVFSPSSREGQQTLPRLMDSFRKEAAYEPSDFPVLPFSSIPLA